MIKEERLGTLPKKLDWKLN